MLWEVDDELRGSLDGRGLARGHAQRPATHTGPAVSLTQSRLCPRQRNCMVFNDCAGIGADLQARLREVEDEPQGSVDG
jgi:hypothetical protein